MNKIILQLTKNGFSIETHLIKISPKLINLLIYVFWGKPNEKAKVHVDSFLFAAMTLIPIMTGLLTNTLSSFHDNNKYLKNYKKQIEIL